MKDKRVARQDCLFWNRFKTLCKERVDIFSVGNVAFIIILLIMWLPVLQNFLSNWNGNFFRAPVGDGERYIYTAHLLIIPALILNQLNTLIILFFIKKLDTRKDLEIFNRIKDGMLLYFYVGIAFFLITLLYLLFFIIVGMTTFCHNTEFFASSPWVIGLMSITLIIGGYFTAKADNLMGFSDICKQVDIPFTISMTLILIFFSSMAIIHSNSFTTGLSSGALAFQLILATLLVPPNTYSPEAIKTRFQKTAEKSGK